MIVPAKLFAIGAHEACGQKRKYTGEPYWHHPAAVASTVALSPLSSEWSICAAWLHDVVEDTAVTIETICALFGPQVGYLVRGMTKGEYGVSMNRAARMSAEIIRIRDVIAESRLLGPELATIKLADLIDNTESIVEHDANFAVRYMAEKRELLPVLSDGCPTLFAKANGIVEGYYRGRG